MTDLWPIWVTSFAVGLVAYLIGFGHGWRLGSKWGEANGVRWATDRLSQANQQMSKR